MVVAPAGTFVMGSPENEAERSSDEGPQREVRIAKPFAVGKFEVTFAEWDGFVKDTGHKTDGGCWVWTGSGWKTEASKSWRDPGFAQEARSPAVCVSWDDAQAYVKWLSDKTGKQYRLLSEAEWEYAARAGTSTPFWWGASITPDQANYDGNLTYGGGTKGIYRQRTVVVGSFRANPWGLHDMHGNVWEWVADCYVGNYEGAPVDGLARQPTGSCVFRALRGGSWSNNPWGLRAASRFGYSPDSRGSSIGFRVARTLNP